MALLGCRWVRRARRALSVPGSPQRASRDLGAAHDATEAAGVVDCQMLAGAVVPEGDGPRLPAEAAGGLGGGPMLQQIVEQRPALVLPHVLKADGVGRVGVEGLAGGVPGPR